MLERKPRGNREGGCSGSSDYIALTLLSMGNRQLNQTKQIGQLIHRIRNQNYNKYKIVETLGDQ